MSYPRKAVVLAAGLGTRMRPLTLQCPKPLMPFWGVPILTHALKMLQNWGTKEVLVNVHYQAESIIDFLRTNPIPGLRVSISFEPEILGTGGLLRRASWFLDQPFWMFNADVVASLNPEGITHCFSQHEPLSVLWMHSQKGPRTVRVINQEITDFMVKDPSGPDTFTFCGLHLLSPTILDWIPKDEGYFSIIKAYMNAQQAGRKVMGVCCEPSFWADLGSPEAYLQAHEEVWQDPSGNLLPQTQRSRVKSLQRQGFIRDWAVVPDTAIIEPNSVLNRTVLWDNVVVKKGVSLQNLIAGKETKITTPVSNMVLPAPSLLSPKEAEVAPIAPPDAMAEVFPARGSDRSFYRLTAQQQSCILVRYGKDREENTYYAEYANLLHNAGVRVPRVLHHEPSAHFTFFEDLGNHDLLAEVHQYPDASPIHAYRLTLETMLNLHVKGTKAAQTSSLALRPTFDHTLYRWERDFFATHFLQGYLGWSKKQCMPVLKELSNIEPVLLSEPLVLIHRDFQSTNVLLHQGEAVLIDFQGMRLGPASYDVASLLADPYVMLPEKIQTTLLNDLSRNHPSDMLVDHFHWAAVQRLAQALGAFARLGKQPDTRRFLTSIPPGVEMMNRCLKHLPNMPTLWEMTERFLNEQDIKPKPVDR